MNIQEAFLTKSPYNRPGTVLKKVTAIAWHYVGNPGTSALNNRNYFENLGKTHTTYASSHFIIGLEGEILQLIPLDEISYATNEANSYSISVECCHPATDGKFNEATYGSMVELGAYLDQKFNLDPFTGNIRHYDVTGKDCPKWFVDHPEDWDKFRHDIKNKMNGVDEEMTTEERQKFNELVDSAAKLDQRVSELEDQLKIQWGYVVDNMEEWAREPIKALVDAGLLEGDENGNLQLNWLMLRLYTVLGRIWLKFKK